MKDGLIIGYSRFTNKEGIERLVVDVVKAPTDFDKRYGRVGMKTAEIWMPTELFDRFDNTVIGKVITCKYEVSGRYANVVDVSFE